MATRRKSLLKKKVSILSLAETAWLYDQPQAGNPFEYLELNYNKAIQQTLWKANRTEVLKSWIAANPCTRPSPFWLIDTTPDRLSLSGNYHAQCLQDKAIIDFAKKVKDNPAAQAVYLHEHGLLTAAEKSYLKKHPELLQPGTPPWSRPN